MPAGMGDVALYTELGRFMLAPYGYLVTRAIHEKHIYKEYIGVDACACNLMRPAMYGAYHHITVMGKEDAPCDHKYDVAGSLCENNDKFAVDRMLPKIDMGDLLVIHDTGAHGFAMGYNYNGKLRSAELLLQGGRLRGADSPGGDAGGLLPPHWSGENAVTDKSATAIAVALSLFLVRRKHQALVLSGEVDEVVISPVALFASVVHKHAPGRQMEKSVFTGGHLIDQLAGPLLIHRQGICTRQLVLPHRDPAL